MESNTQSGKKSGLAFPEGKLYLGQCQEMEEAEVVKANSVTVKNWGFYFKWVIVIFGITGFYLNVRMFSRIMETGIQDDWSGGEKTWQREYLQ